MTAVKQVKQVKQDEQAVVISTAHRGVFFGYATVSAIDAWERDTNASIKLRRARMCLVWPTTQRGYPGLVADGPHEGARVSPPASSLTFANVASVGDATPLSVARWESAPWK